LLPSLISAIAILILEHKNSRMRRAMSRIMPDMIPTNRYSGLILSSNSLIPNKDRRFCW
jgi:hypothetical protein